MNDPATKTAKPRSLAFHAPPPKAANVQVTDLRIALFTGNYNYVRDGANQALNRLVGYLAEKGAAVRIYSPRTDKPAFPSVGKVINIPALPLPGRSEYRVPLYLPASAKRDIAAFAPTHFHIASPEVLGHRAVTLARKSGVPVIASVHTRFETYPRYYHAAFLEPLFEAGLRRLYRRCDAIFAPSESMAELLRQQRMNFNVGIWSRGIDRTIFNPQARDLAWRRGHGIGDHEAVVGFVGRLVMEKGLDVFSDALDALAARGVAHRVLVVGEGPARAWFAERMPSAVFAGFQKGADLGRAVASMDMLFNPSVTETFGNVTLEAMAAGLPVVAARATGSTSLVKHGVSGKLVEPGDIQAFADALQLYCRDEAARAAAGAAGEAASRSYGWDAVNQTLVDGYLEVSRRRAGGIEAGTWQAARVDG